MKKLIIAIAVVIVAIVAVFVIKAATTPERTTMEQMLYDANKYTKANHDDISVITDQEKIMADQDALIEDLKAKYAEGDYSLENPFVAVNPFERNELSAYIAFPADDAKTVSYSVVTNDTKYPFNYSTDEITGDIVVLPVIGLFENTENKVEVTVENSAGEKTTSTVKIKTEKADSNYNPNTSTKEELSSEAGIDLTDEQLAEMSMVAADVDDATVKTDIVDDSIMDYADGFIITETSDVYDFDGNLRSSTPKFTFATAPIKVQDGLFLMQSTSSTYLELDFMGRVHNVISTPANEDGEQQFSFHHDAVMSDDGKYYYFLGSWLGDAPEDSTDIWPESLVMVYDRDKGEFTDFFDYSDDFAEGMQSVNPVADGRDPLHMNSIDIYEEANELILSSKSQSTVFGVDIKTGDVEWIIKDPEGVTNEDPDLLLEPQGDMLYTSGNHTAFVLDTDKYDTTADDLYISVYDNRNCVDEDQTPAWSTIGDDAEGVCATSEKSSMIIYHVNMADRTVETMEEIAPAERWSITKSSVFTNHPGIYEISYADLSQAGTASVSQTMNHSDLYVTDYDGNTLMSATFDAMTNIYRSRLINFDELDESLQSNVADLDL